MAITLYNDVDITALINRVTILENTVVNLQAEIDVLEQQGDNWWYRKMMRKSRKGGSLARTKKVRSM